MSKSDDRFTADAHEALRKRCIELESQLETVQERYRDKCGELADALGEISDMEERAESAESRLGGLSKALIEAQKYLAKQGSSFDPDKSYKIVCDTIIGALDGSLPGYEHNRAVEDHEYKPDMGQCAICKRQESEHRAVESQFHGGDGKGGSSPGAVGSRVTPSEASPSATASEDQWPIHEEDNRKCTGGLPHAFCSFPGCTCMDRVSDRREPGESS